MRYIASVKWGDKWYKGSPYLLTDKEDEAFVFENISIDEIYKRIVKEYEVAHGT